MTRPVLLVELQKLDGTWVDVSSSVTLRESVEITRGRGDEDGQPGPGELHLTFEARDKRFTHGDSTYDCRAEQPIYVAVGTAAAEGSTPDVWDDLAPWSDAAAWSTAAGPLVPRFLGSVQEWPTTWDGPIGSLVLTRIQAFDRLARLERHTMLSLIEEAYLLHQPKGYWRMAEAEGAETAGDFTGSGVSLVPTGTVTFGSGVGPTDGLTGAVLSAGAVLSSPVTQLGLPATSASQGIDLELVVSTTGTNLQLARIRGRGFTLTVGVSATGTATATFVTSSGNVYTVEHVGGAVNDGTVVHLGVILLNGQLAIYRDGTGYSTLLEATETHGLRWTSLTVGGAANVAPVTVSHVGLFVMDSTGWADIAYRAAAVRGFEGDTSTARLKHILELAVRPNGSANPLLNDLVATTGNTRNVAAQAGGDGSALDMIQAVAVTEGGLVDMRPEVREDRLRLITSHGLMAAATGTATAVAGDLVDPASLTIQADTKDLLNVATGSRVNGAEQRAEIQPSIDAYGLYDGSWSDLLLLTDTEVKDRLWWEVTNGKAVRYRLTGFSVDVQSASAAQAQALLALDVGSRIQVTDLPSTSPVGTTADLLVQGWTEAIDRESWTWEPTTSAAQDFQVWLLGTAAWGALGTTTRLGY